MRKIGVFQLLALWGVVSFMITISVKGASYEQVLFCEDSDFVYTVQPDDRLFEIGMMYGEFRFWEAIYIANADLIENPNMIYPGQQLEIPQPVYSFHESGLTVEAVLDYPFCEKESLPISSVDPTKLDYYTMEDLTRDEKSGGYFTENSVPDELSENKPDRLSEFRDAFNAVVNTDAADDKIVVGKDSLEHERQRDIVQQQSERQIMMEIDGMVLDETRSKVGRDFYDVFYSNWQSPENASNFSIRIAEQPNPSLGTIIYVEVNDTETFRMRIQPRYDFIQQAGQYAVRQTYSHLQNNDYRLEIY